jgi:hypothetical protein
VADILKARINPCANTLNKVWLAKEEARSYYHHVARSVSFETLFMN